MEQCWVSVVDGKPTLTKQSLHCARRVNYILSKLDTGRVPVYGGFNICDAGPALNQHEVNVRCVCRVFMLHNEDPCATYLKLTIPVPQSEHNTLSSVVFIIKCKTVVYIIVRANMTANNTCGNETI